MGLTVLVVQITAMLMTTRLGPRAVRCQCSQTHKTRGSAKNLPTGQVRKADFFLQLTIILRSGMFDGSGQFIIGLLKTHRLFVRSWGVFQTSAAKGGVRDPGRARDACHQGWLHTCSHAQYILACPADK